MNNYQQELLTIDSFINTPGEIRQVIGRDLEHVPDPDQSEASV